MSHDHAHEPAALAGVGRAFAIGNSTFVVVEAVFGFRPDSTALLADSTHNLTEGRRRAFQSRPPWVSLMWTNSTSATSTPREVRSRYVIPPGLVLQASAVGSRFAGFCASSSSVRRA